jgi:hypothetical protein
MHIKPEGVGLESPLAYTVQREASIAACPLCKQVASHRSSVA